jgi:N-acetylmuramoyl-L-alanine amidase
LQAKKGIDNHSLKGKVIAVDPGHGGSDTGAIISNPKEEKLLSNRDFDKKVAIGIYNGIKKFYLVQ